MNIADAPVLTLADLAAWSRPGTALAVLGHPIKHSLSPRMHNAALAELARTDARFATWQYVRFEIHPDDLPRALDLLHAKKFRGVNLTVPHKIIAFDRVSEIDPAARPVGAVNTLRWTERGWHGFNTDGYGLAALPRPIAVFDMIYNPPQTGLLRAAADRGLPHANGLAMLVHQGAKSLEHWSGIPAGQTAPTMAAAARAARGLP